MRDLIDSALTLARLLALALILFSLIAPDGRGTLTLYIVGAALLPLATALVTETGRRVAGLAAAARPVAVLSCALLLHLAPSPWGLVVLALDPVMVWLIRRSGPRALAGMWAGAALAGFTALPLLGGILAEAFYWPSADPVFAPRAAAQGADPARFAPRPWLILLFCVPALGLAVGLGRARLNPVSAVGTGTALTILAGSLLLLTDPALVRHTPHLDAYLGPLQATRTGWPLVNVFPQYGLTYLLLAPVGWFLPPTYEAAALVIALLNAAMIGGVAIAILRAGGGGPAGWIVAGAMTLSCALLLPMIPTPSPAHLSLRFLALWGLTLSLLRPGGGGVVAAIWLGLACLSSLDSAVSAIALYVLAGQFDVRAAGGRLGAHVRRAGRDLLMPLPTLALFALITRLGGGDWPRLGPYLEILGSYWRGDIAWFTDPGSIQAGSGWVLLLGGVGVGLALGWRGFLVAADDPAVTARRRALALLAAAALLMGISFAGRTYIFRLTPLYLPLMAMIGIAVLTAPRRPWGRTLAAALLLVPVLAMAADRFARPVILWGWRGGANSITLRACFDVQWCGWPGLRDRVFADPDADLERAVGYSSRLLRDWTPGPTGVILVPNQSLALLGAGRSDGLGIINVDNDDLSPTLTRRALDRLAALPPGTRAVLFDVPAQLNPFQRRLLAGLLDRPHATIHRAGPWIVIEILASPPVN